MAAGKRLFNLFILSPTLVGQLFAGPLAIYLTASIGWTALIPQVCHSLFFRIGDRPWMRRTSGFGQDPAHVFKRVGVRPRNRGLRGGFFNFAPIAIQVTEGKVPELGVIHLQHIFRPGFFTIHPVSQEIAAGFRIAGRFNEWPHSGAFQTELSAQIFKTGDCGLKLPCRQSCQELDIILGIFAEICGSLPVHLCFVVTSHRAERVGSPPIAIGRERINFNHSPRKRQRI